MHRGFGPISSNKRKGVPYPAYTLICHRDHVKTHGNLPSLMRPVQLVLGSAGNLPLFFDSDSLLGFPVSAAPAVFYFYKKKYPVLLGNQIDLSVPVLKIPLQNPDAVFLQEADCLLFSKSACLTSGNMFP